MPVEIFNEVILAFDRPEANQSKPWVYLVNHPPTGSNKCFERNEDHKKIRGLAFMEAKLKTFQKK
jgi:hypothetical protein